MKRKLKKLVSVAMAAVFICSGLNVNLNEAYAASTGDIIKNGQLEIAGDYYYEYYDTDGEIAFMATAMDGDWLTSDSEICIINSEGESITLVNKDDEGDRKYVDAEISEDSIVILQCENGGYAYVNKELNVIGEGKRYELLGNYADEENAFYLMVNLENLVDADTGSYAVDFVDREGKVIKENAFMGYAYEVADMYRFGDKYIVYFYNNAEIVVLNENFEEIYRDGADSYAYLDGMEYFAYINMDRQLFTVDMEMNKKEIVIDSIEAAQWVYVYAEIDSYYLDITDAEYNDSRYVLVDKETIAVDSNVSKEEIAVRTEDGVLVNGNLITYEQVYELLGLDTNNMTWAEDYVEFYYGYGEDDDLYVAIDVNRYDYIGCIFLAKKHDYSLDKALICGDMWPTVRQVNNDNTFVIESFDDSFCYIPTDDGWLEVSYADSNYYYMANDENMTLDKYDYNNEYISSMEYGDILTTVAKLDEVPENEEDEPEEIGEILGISGMYDTVMIIDVLENKTNLRSQMLLVSDYNYDLDKAFMVMKDKYDIVETEGHFVYRNADGLYLAAEDGWSEVYTYKKLYEDIDLGIYIYEYYVYEKADGTFALLPNIYENEEIRLDTPIVVGDCMYGNKVVIINDTVDGETLYTYGVKLDVEYGDATGDGKINVMDAVLIKKHIAGFEGLTINTNACDVNSDGRINVMDAVMLLKYIAGFDNIILGGN